MRKYLFAVSLLVIALISFMEANVSSHALGESKIEVKANLKDFNWLVGRWHTKSAGELFEEHWMSPAGDMMLGMGREVKADKLSFFEYLRIEARADGIYYVAQPFGKAQTDFKLTTNNDSLSVFENPTHDFPKRIEYKRQKDGSVAVRGSGEENDREKTFEFVLYKD